MPAPYKQGLNYYPREIGMMKSRKFRKPRMKHGYVVNVIYDAILDLIYGDKGYYLDYSEPDDVIWEIQQYLFGKYQVSSEEIAEIIEELVACELFSGDHFRAKILTSKRVQETFYSATVDRKAIDVDFGIWLLTEEKMRELSSKSIILDKFINRPINAVNQTNNGVNQPNNPQSKGKQSKEEESRGEEPPPAPPPSPKQDELVKRYGQALVDTYIAKAQRYRKTGTQAVLCAAQWLAEDEAAGKFAKKASKSAIPSGETSMNIDEYERRLESYVPVYRKESQNE